MTRLLQEVGLFVLIQIIISGYAFKWISLLTLTQCHTLLLNQTQEEKRW